MIHQYVQDNGHMLTITQVVLYGQMFVVIDNLGSNDFRRHNHA
jgi:hypothetical protein